MALVLRALRPSIFLLYNFFFFFFRMEITKERDNNSVFRAFTMEPDCLDSGLDFAIC